MIDKGYAIPTVDCAAHYDTLMDEGNDPVNDPPALRAYMDQWDGDALLNRLQLWPDCSVLEIGVGSGRLAVRVAPLCGKFIGIDISEKTVEQGRRNLAAYPHVCLIHGDFLSLEFSQQFDCIYSSLTWLHIQDKQAAMYRVASLLTVNGRFVLSISKDPSEWLDYGTRRVRIYPDDTQSVLETASQAGLELGEQAETAFAHIFVFIKHARG